MQLAERPTRRKAGATVLISVGVLALAFLVLYGITSWFNIASLYVDRWNGVAEQGPREDYAAFLAAGRLVLEGRGSEIYDVAAVGKAEHSMFGRPVGGSGVLAYFNPPFVAVAFAPLTALPLGVATLVLGALNVVAAGVGCAVVVLMLQPRTALSRGLVVVGFLTFFPVTWTVIHGQFSLLLMLGWLGFIMSQARGQERLSGAYLALLLIKPQLTVLAVVVLVVQRKWEALKLFGGIAAWLAVVSVVVSGPAVLTAYPAFLLDSTGWDGDGISPASMLGIGGFAARQFEVNSGPYLLLSWGLGGLVLVAFLWKAWAWRTVTGTAAFPVWGAAIVGTLLVNPHLYRQDLTLLVVVLVLGALSASDAARRLVWPALAGVTWLALYVLPRAETATGLTACLAVMFVLFGAHLVSGRQKTEAIPDLAVPPMARAA